MREKPDFLSKYEMKGAEQNGYFSITVKEGRTRHKTRKLPVIDPEKNMRNMIIQEAINNGELYVAFRYGPHGGAEIYINPQMVQNPSGKKTAIVQDRLRTIKLESPVLLEIEPYAIGQKGLQGQIFGETNNGLNFNIQVKYVPG